MSSMRKVFWRAGFALALLPVSLALVAASPAAPMELQPGWQIELARSDLHQRIREHEVAIAREFADGQARGLQTAVAIEIARATKQKAGGNGGLNIRIVREGRLQPSG